MKIIYLKTFNNKIILNIIKIEYIELLYRFNKIDIINILKILNIFKDIKVNKKLLKFMN